MRRLPFLAAAVAVVLLALPAVARAASDPMEGISREHRKLAKRCVRTLERAGKGAAADAAAKALLLLGRQSAAATLEERLKTNPGDSFAKSALAEADVPPHRAEVRTLLRNPELPVDVFTTFALAVGVDQPEVRSRLETIWKDASQPPYERIWAAKALVDGGQKEPRDFLRKLLADKDDYARAVSASALLGAEEPKAREALVAILRDADSGFWDRAAISLGRGRDRESLPLLAKKLARAKDPYDKVWIAWSVLHILGYSETP